MIVYATKLHTWITDKFVKSVQLGGTIPHIRALHLTPILAYVSC